MNPDALRHYRQDGFPDLGIRMARGEGHVLYDDAGRAYLDFCAGFGAVSCGHGHPHVLGRVEAQLRTLVPTMYFRNALIAECVSELDARLPRELHTLALYSTGAEAIEQALRLARAMTGRRRFLSFLGHFHGKTHGSMFLLKQYPPVYGPRPDGYATTLAFGAPEQGDFDIAAFEAALEAEACGGELAGVVCEAAIGYSGPYALPEAFLPALRRFCDRHGAMLIVDEIFSSFLRCGEWFLSGREGCRPDLLCFGKGLGNGFPVAAVAGTAAAAEKLRDTAPGSTFAGNLAACAAALGVAEVLGSTPGLAGHVAACERLFFEKVEAAFPGGARGVVPGGKGLLLGIRLDQTPDEVMAHFRATLDAGVLASYNPRGLRLSPPLLMPREVFAQGVDTLLRVLDAGLPRASS